MWDAFGHGSQGIADQMSSDPSCNDRWVCQEWGDCINDYQTRVCANSVSECATVNKPEQRQSCTEDFSLAGAAGSMESEDAAINENQDVPAELFDITFALSASLVDESGDLQSITTLQNFGTDYVPARLIYTVYDSVGEPTYETIEETRVYTDQAVNRRFSDLALPSGLYTMVLSVEYAGVNEDFNQQFQVKTTVWQRLRKFFTGGRNI